MNDYSVLNSEKTFPLSKRDIHNILELALCHGADFSEIFFEHRIHSSIHMEEDIIKETSESIVCGLGIRAIHEDRTGYGYTNDLALEKIKKAALTAAAIADKKSKRHIAPFSPLITSHNFYPISRFPHQEPLEEKIALVNRVYSSAQNFDQRIKKIKVIFSDSTQSITVANSEGLLVSDHRPLVRLTCLTIAEENDKREAGYCGGGGRVSLDYFQERLTPEEIGQEASKEALLLLEAAEPPAGEMPVVLAPGHSGVLIHEAVGHLLEADFNRKKTSVFWDKMGKMVGSSQLNIFDDPTIPFFRGSYNVDDEGTFPEKTVLIQRGRLVGMLQDRLSAKVMHMAATGHGRRQDFTNIPLPRMSNTYVDRGEHDPEEIIRSVKRGFYAHRFQGGQVEDSGKFTFTVSSGSLIEEGRLTAPVKQVTLIGTNVDILKKIEMLGSDLEFGLQTGTCGKEGQVVPVNDGCPTIKISRMTVGGRR